MALLMFSFAVVPAMPAEYGPKRIGTFKTKISTNGGGIPGELALTVYQPTNRTKHRAFVMCPGSWEYGKAWDVYFPPFTPEFIAAQGYTVVTWDPRGTFMLATGWQELSDLFEPERYGVGHSSLYPPSILPPDSKFVVEDLYNVITYTAALPGVKEIGIIGFSHGASYPIIEKVTLDDDRIGLIIAIEPIGDETSLASMLSFGDSMISLVGTIPTRAFDVCWSALRIFGVLGLPSHYINSLDCDLLVVQSLQYHASLSGLLGIGTCVDPGLFVYDNAPGYRRLNRNLPGTEIDRTRLGDYDWFPAPIWEDGDLLCEYFMDCVEPRF
jgi:hypothetical protein